MKILDGLHGFFWSNARINNCNSYLIEGNRRVLIDPGHEVLFGHVADGLSALSLEVKDIDLVVMTHGHPDHVEGARKFNAGPTLLALHEIELDFVKNLAPQYGQALGLSDFEPQILLQEGDLWVEGLHFKVIHTPGHSPGSVCLYWEEKRALFTGDVLFYQGIGRTDLPGGNGEALKRSLRRISKLDAEHVLPGHGPAISGAERVKANFHDVERSWFGYL